VNDIGGIGFTIPVVHQDISVQFHEFAEQRNIAGVHPAAHETHARFHRQGRQFMDRDACTGSGRNLQSNAVARSHHPNPRVVF
jgi:hypothetical protein